jgi:amino acid transporter/mannitol/fructose-specific phosphotransferase system IIA component (Ntr-type)
MAVLDHSKRLKKELSLFGVYAIATGTTLSAGFFLLPGLAAAEAGPAVVLCYLIAALLLLPATFSIVELATAMPRAGGAYYFLDRSLGPLAGTIGGFGTWLALVLKAAFALIGLGAYVALVFRDAPVTLIAAGLAVLFGVVNLLGAKKVGGFQVALVLGLLAILAWFIARGSVQVNREHFSGFFDKGFTSIVSTAGLVFISYVGVTNIASVSEEVKDPERNLPLGIFLALGTAVLVYALGIGVMVGVVGWEQLAETLTPVERTAEAFGVRWGVVAVSLAALLAFSSVANACILSASRYPMAMSRDHLLPRILGLVGKRGTPMVSIGLTVTAILFFLIVLDPIRIAKLASAFQLLMFALLCLAVIVMRESGIESYDPGYRSPLYPWMQIVGIVAPVWVIVEMGWLPALFSLGVIGVGVTWYVIYARRRVERHGAIYHVFERLGRRRFHDLDRELRGIMQEKGLREEDPFDEVVVRGIALDAEANESFEDIASRASILLAERLPLSAETLCEGFLQGTRTGATPVTGGVALPHLRLPGIAVPHLVVVRSRDGIEISTGDVFGGTHESSNTHAIFFLVSPDADPRQHLRILAQLAGQVSQKGFMGGWLAAADERQLKEILLRHDRHVVLHVLADSRAAVMIGRPLRELDIPDGCLVAVIHRADETIVPRGETVVEEGDHLTVIGSVKGIEQVHQRYGSEPRAGAAESPEP